MYDNKVPLREAARTALEQAGYGIELMKGAVGARLQLKKDGRRSVALVRTSSDRAVGWMRTADGEWRGLRDGDLVIVAALAPTGKAAEIYAFENAVVEQALNENVAARLKKNESLSVKAPVFVSLDPVGGNSPRSAGSNLRSLAQWTRIVPLERIVAATGEISDPGDPIGTFARAEELRNNAARRLRAEVATATGIPIEKIAVQIEIRVVI